MDDGGWSDSLSENIWLDLRPTDFRKGLCLPKEISVTDLYKSLRLEKQSPATTTYGFFFFLSCYSWY